MTVAPTGTVSAPDASPYGRLGPVLHPLYIRGMAVAQRVRGRTFGFRGALYPYFSHYVHETWRSERAVEIPIARAHLRGAVLEVGNVLAYYDPHEHTVVDKYEDSPGVLRVDVVDYAPVERFDTIIAISTLEHVGFDEEPADQDKPRAAVAQLAGLLAPGGTLLATFPVGYNPGIDTIVSPGAGVFDEVAFLQRVSADNRWQEATWEQVKDSEYGAPFHAANGLAVAFVRR